MHSVKGQITGLMSSNYSSTCKGIPGVLSPNWGERYESVTIKVTHHDKWQRLTSSERNSPKLETLLISISLFRGDALLINPEHYAAKAVSSTCFMHTHRYMCCELLCCTHVNALNGELEWELPSSQKILSNFWFSNTFWLNLRVKHLKGRFLIFPWGILRMQQGLNWHFEIAT